MNIAVVRKTILCLILIQTFLVRFWLLGIVPPVSNEFFHLRFISALSGLFSVLLIVLIISRLFDNKTISLLSGWWLSLIPWHIEQSRVFSIYIIYLLVILGFIYLIIVINEKNIKLLLVISFLFTTVLLRPFWFMQNLTVELSFGKIFINFINQISFRLMFFKNDSFWQGGVRNFGIIYPELIPVFLSGVYLLVRKLKFKYLLIIITAVALLLLIASANHNYPETRELFYLTPIIALILSFGTFIFYKRLLHAKIVIKCLLIFYIISVLFGFCEFFHNYFVHYNLRITVDKSYESEKF